MSCANSDIYSANVLITIAENNDIYGSFHDGEIQFVAQGVSNQKKRKTMAGVTGLEPAASGVTGRRSNQLSYTPLCGASSRPEKKRDCSLETAFCVADMWEEPLLLYPATGCQATSPDHASRNQQSRLKEGRMVGGDGIEPPTSTV